MHPMLIPSIPKRRKYRRLTLEQEVAHGSRIDDIAEELYRRGYSSVDHVLGYHSSYRVRSGRFARVETDASCGGEVIHAYLKLDDEARCERFIDATRVVAAESTVDSSCGGHVHVDARGLEMWDVVSLYTLWNYLEDVLYRIGSANSGGHRTIVGRENYAPITPKNLGPLEVQSGMGERYGLNIANYMGALGNCRCGARDQGMASECACNLRRATIEFRVWDATLDPRRIHAHLALSLALVEHARRRRLVSSRLPALGFDYEREVAGNRRGKVLHRLKYVFERLPLTDDERADIAYCCAEGSLAELLAVAWSAPSGYVSPWDSYAPPTEPVAEPMAEPDYPEPGDSPPDPSIREFVAACHWFYDPGAIGHVVNEETSPGDLRYVANHAGTATPAARAQRYLLIRNLASVPGVDWTAHGWSSSPSFVGLSISDLQYWYERVHGQRAPSLASVAVRELLADRSGWFREIAAPGYTPPPAPWDSPARQASVVSGSRSLVDLDSDIDRPF